MRLIRLLMRIKKTNNIEIRTRIIAYNEDFLWDL